MISALNDAEVGGRYMPSGWKRVYLRADGEQTALADMGYDMPWTQEEFDGALPPDSGEKGGDRGTGLCLWDALQ